MVEKGVFQMNPNKCPCECHETFDHGSALVVDTYARRIRSLEEELRQLQRDYDTDTHDLEVALKEEKDESFKLVNQCWDRAEAQSKELEKEIQGLREDVKRYRNG